MELPFPGMDPYLEQPGLWPDVHHRLITAIGDQIQLRLSARYTAIITPYVLYESLEIAPNRWAVPDVGIVDRSLQEESSPYATATIAPAPLTLPASYAIPPPAPDLAPSELAWLDARLRERELRS